ncbi:hypothetical protein HMPREF3134_07915 [Staphylococcus sp. HMSC14D10]|uniref:restriction endonuclease subunit S n=1 Tax=Staphylococcus sp. HMSC14D10 TaxID=1581102 RepID=UPI0008A2C5C9|nr:restriction endonuclease subunit S [Staphylococcus sp. HMSC14D10]OFV28601.1 hypothetical protein HMPREF3134_07915 [Staphylococcus sp. HMSC14D10]
MDFNKYRLKDIAEYKNERIETNQLTTVNYISTENLLPNKQGKQPANNLPSSKTVKKYTSSDILISNIRPYFKKIWQANSLGGHSNDVLNITSINEKISNDYLYYYLSQDKFFQYMTQTSKGTKMPRGDKEAIMEYEIKVPKNIVHQNFISNLGKSLDNKIEINKKIIANLEELSQTLFKRWFVDFEFPDENGNPYKSSGGKMIDSELGKIPNDWKISNFQEITAFNTEMIDTNQLENPLNYIGLEHISRNNIISIDRWENTSKVTGKKLKVCKGDILFGKLRPYFQKVGISPIDGVVSTDIMIFTPNFKNVYYFILLYLSQKNFIRYITSTSTGTRMPRTGKKQINSYKIVLPTNLILTSFNTILNRYTDLIKLLINENAKLIQLRDTLLPKLMSGEIEIPDDIEVNTDELSI